MTTCFIAIPRSVVSHSGMRRLAGQVGSFISVIIPGKPALLWPR
jgi:hypothetical protein